MLVQTQRLEARQQRRDHENDRRNLQQRVRQVLTIGKEKRDIAKDFSKQYLRYFKRDTLQQLVDIGLFRRKRDYSINTHFIPLLFNQAELETVESQERTQVVDDAIISGLESRASKHKAAIKAEFQRREDLKNERIRKEEEAKKAKERRQERRKCLKEQRRIFEIQENLFTNIIPVAEQREYSIAMPIYDIRDYTIEAVPGIYTYGGFVGELIISLFCLQSHVLSKPENAGFTMDGAQMDGFIKELFADAFPQGIAYLRVPADPSQVEEETDISDKVNLASKQLTTGEAHSNYGMKFLISQAKSLGMKRDFIEEIFRALAQIHYQEPQEPVKEPEEGEENYEELKEKVAQENEEIEKSNEQLNRLKSFIKFVTPLEDEPAIPDYKELDEKCFIRIRNYRDSAAQAQDNSMET